MFRRLGFVLVAMVLTAGAVVGKEKTYSWSSDPTILELPDAPVGQVAPLISWFNLDKGQLYQSYTLDLIAATMGRCYGYTSIPELKGTKLVHACKAQFDSEGQVVRANGQPVQEIANFPGPDDYVVIHILTWKTLDAGKHVQGVDKQNWYVFHADDPDWDDAAFASNNRVFGKKKIYFLYVHFNRNSDALYTVRYDLKAKSKMPAYLDHFVGIGQLFGIGSAPGAGVTEAKIQNVWGAHGFGIDYVPSDVTLTPQVDPKDVGSSSVQLDPKTFDNEGRYHVDFSVGVAIKQIRNISYTSSSNTLVPTSIDKNSIFAFVNYYPKPFDIKSSGLSKYPHVVAGFGIVSKPLQKAFIGAGFGPIFANFYAGVLLNTKRLPVQSGCGHTPTAAEAAGTLTNKTCPEFGFGLNVQVGSVLDALKSKK